MKYISFIFPSLDAFSENYKNNKIHVQCQGNGLQKNKRLVLFLFCSSYARRHIAGGISRQHDDFKLNGKI